MTVYDTRSRCPYCRKFDLPCNNAVHANPLFPYLSAVDNAVPPVVPGLAEPTVRLATPEPSRAPAQARALSTVALVMIAVCAVIVALVAYGLIVGVTLT